MNKVKRFLMASSFVLLLAGVGATANSSNRSVYAQRIRQSQLIKKHNYVPKKKHVVNKLTNNHHAKNKYTIRMNRKHRRMSHKMRRYYRAMDIVNYAKHQIGKHHYSEGMGVSKDSRNGMLYHHRHGRADCSSFVYFVYRHLGYKVPTFSGNAWTTNSSIIGPKRVRAKKTIPGSIVDNPIHMAILTERYHGPKTKVIEEGGYWNGGNKYRRNVNEGRLKGAFKPEDGHYRFYNPVR